MNERRSRPSPSAGTDRRRRRVARGGGARRRRGARWRPLSAGLAAGAVLVLVGGLALREGGDPAGR
ncbi:hypothetical protein GTX07_13770, partial [Streptomyces sp. SID5606]|nr:hypothetical protein [Streptomyces sp. SID5606]